MPLHYTAAASSRVTKPSSSSPRRVRSPLDAARRQRRASARSSLSARGGRDAEPSGTAAAAAGPPVSQAALLAPLFCAPRQQSLPAALPALLALLHGATFDPALPPAPNDDDDGDDTPPADGLAAAPSAARPPRGLGSARLARTLRVRAALPPLATHAHVAALRASPTAAEREVAAAVRAGGVARVVVVPGEALLVRTDAWVGLVRAAAGVGPAAGSKLVALLEGRDPTAPLDDGEIAELVSAGLLTGAPGRAAAVSTGILAGSNPAADAATLGSLASVSRAGARHASGTLEAAGASSSLAHLGGGGTRPNLLPSTGGGEDADPLRGHRPSVPNAGPFLRLLADGRAHMLALLARGGPRRSLPLGRLREYWNGGGVPAWRTKKWRDLHGLRLEWVLADCVGSGLVECFPTGSVGIGVRVL